MSRVCLIGICCMGGWIMAAGAQTPANGLAVLLTDYGADSIYVGSIKGAMYKKNPQVRIDAITNSVPPFDVLAGAYMLAEACDEFPAGTAFCCVVDPGVGTPRKRIVMESNSGQWFVAPDNGLLTVVADRYGIKQIREATNPDWWRHGAVSSTFQGRDIFGPVAAMLAGGAPLEQAGPPLSEFMRLDEARARVENDAAFGAVIRADVYGNLVTNLTAKTLETLGVKPGDTVEVVIGKQSFSAPWVNTYADVPQGNRLVLLQSIGLLECAVNKGSLAESLAEGLHAPVTLRKAK